MDYFPNLISKVLTLIIQLKYVNKCMYIDPTIILHSISFRREIRYFVFREEYTTRELLENGKLKRKLWIKIDEVTKSWRKLENEELYQLDFQKYIKTSCRVTWRTINLGHLMRKLETNMKMGLTETEREGLNWIKMSVDRDKKRLLRRK